MFVRNPFNKNQVKKISLSVKDVDCIVFWTKNPDSFFDKIPKLHNYSFYFNYTLNQYPNSIEMNLPDITYRINTFRKLSSIIGKEIVLWRYDPVFFTETFGEEEHIGWFEYIASMLSGYTERCITSILTDYSKTRRNMSGTGYRIPDILQSQVLLNKMKKISESYNIELNICSQRVHGIPNAACIDSELIKRISGKDIDAAKDKHQRQYCNCVSSIDIGSYNTCINRCLYCYANSNHETAAGKYKLHKPENDFIDGNLSGTESIALTQSHINRQLKLF